MKDNVTNVKLVEIGQINYAETTTKLARIRHSNGARLCYAQACISGILVQPVSVHAQVHVTRLTSAFSRNSDLGYFTYSM